MLCVECVRFASLSRVLLLWGRNARTGISTMRAGTGIQPAHSAGLSQESSAERSSSTPACFVFVIFSIQTTTIRTVDLES